MIILLLYIQFDIIFNKFQISNNLGVAANEDNDLEDDVNVIDIDKLSPSHTTTTGISCDRGDGDGAIWQKIHAEDSML